MFFRSIESYGRVYLITNEKASDKEFKGCSVNKYGRLFGVILSLFGFARKIVIINNKNFKIIYVNKKSLYKFFARIRVYPKKTWR